MSKVRTSKRRGGSSYKHPITERRSVNERTSSKIPGNNYTGDLTHLIDNGITITRVKGNWVDGKYGELYFQAKVFAEPSVYGINDSRTSKLVIVKNRKSWGNPLFNYDRGYDVRAKNKTAQEIVDIFRNLK